LALVRYVVPTAWRFVAAPLSENAAVLQTNRMRTACTAPANRQSAPSLLLMIAALAFAGCGDDRGPSGPGDTPADLPTFFAALPAWSAFSPPLADAEMATGEPVEDEAPTTIDGDMFVCTTTPYSLTTTPEDIVTLNPDVEVLWVGALLQGDGHLGGIGSLAELPIRQRGPLTLTLDLLSGANTQTVASPTVATVNQAIGGLVETAALAGHRSGSNIFYTSETTHSLDQAALKMGLSASYMGSTVKTSLSADLSDESRTVTAYFIQRMFTASMVLPQNPEDVFSSEFTQEMLARETTDGRMGPGNLPVFVSSVTYGRILMFSFTSTSTEAKIKATLNVLYNGGDFGGELDSELQSVLENAQIRVVTVGGDAQQALDLIRENNMGAYFTSDAPLTTARPISYTVRNLDDNVIARVSETTSYNLEQCIPADVPVTGARYRVRITEIKAEALPMIDWPVIVTPTSLLENSNGAELYYTLYVQGVQGGEMASRLGARFEPTLLNSFETRIRENQVFPLKLDGGPTPSFELDIHFDGRDFIKVHGDIWDADVDSPDDRFQIARTFKWPASPLPTHDSPGFSSAVVTDDFGNKFRVTFNWQKILDLTN
jgi:hypothetical protein